MHEKTITILIDENGDGVEFGERLVHFINPPIRLPIDLRFV